MSKFLMVLCLGVVWSTSLPAADPPPAQLDPAAMQEMFAKLAQVGPQHERFKAMVGHWDCQCRNFEGDPNHPAEWQAAAEFKLLLGGRYLQQEFSGVMPGNLPYAGQGLTAYDNAQQKYVGTWVDSMGTGILHTSGTHDAATKTTTEVGHYKTPMVELQYKMVTQWESADRFDFTMSMVTPAGDQKMMEIAYTRKK